MSRIFITGSSDGLGKMAALMLVTQGHQVVLHGRNKDRAAVAMAGVPGAETVLTGDLSSIAETIHLAEEVNKLGLFDAVIHNAGIGDKERSRMETTDGLSHVFAINSLAPYILTCLITRPKRLIYLSSGLHREGNPDLRDLAWKQRRWNGLQAYSDSKLQDVILAFAVARKWPDVFSNALDPGWVATKMGGRSAPDNLEDGSTTQAWLAVSNDQRARVTGKYFYHQKVKQCHPAAADQELQEKYLTECARISGILFPLS
jgi:NAD(P)-dependent dehydrogenase (short-subunit alcohol dehydrogenase family)